MQQQVLATATVVRWRLAWLSKPETWRRRKRRQSQKIRRSVQKQRRSTVWDNQRKTFGVVISPARLTAWIAASALILLTGTELFGTALSWVKLSPIWHVFSFAVDTRPIATLLDYASHPIDPRSYSSVAVTAVGCRSDASRLLLRNGGRRGVNSPQHAALVAAAAAFQSSANYWMRSLIVCKMTLAIGSAGSIPNTPTDMNTDDFRRYT